MVTFKNAPSALFYNIFQLKKHTVKKSDFLRFSVENLEIFSFIFEKKTSIFFRDFQLKTWKYSALFLKKNINFFARFSVENFEIFHFILKTKHKIF